MAYSNLRLTFFLFLFSVFGCVGSTPPVSPVPPNAKIFDFPFTTLWKATITVIENDFKFPLEVADDTEGFFSTKQITEQTLGITIRNRISGRIISQNDKSLLTLYNQRQTFDGEHWKALPTDYVLEGKILQALTQHLSTFVK